MTFTQCVCLLYVILSLCIIVTDQCHRRPSCLSDDYASWTDARMHGLEETMKSVRDSITAVREDISRIGKNISSLQSKSECTRKPFFVVYTIKKSRQAAQDYCKKSYYGSALVSLTTEQKWRDVVKAVAPWRNDCHVDHSLSGFWTSGTKLPDGTWEASKGVAMVASIWALNQPDNENSLEDCAQITGEANSYRLNDESCTSEMCFVCEINGGY